MLYTSCRYVWQCPWRRCKVIGIANFTPSGTGKCLPHSFTLRGTVDSGNKQGAFFFLLPGGHILSFKTL